MMQPTGAKGFAGRLAQERRLKSAREHRDVEKQDVAKALGVSNSTYGRWETGTMPDDDMMEALGRYFGVTPAWLRYGTEPREAAPPFRISEEQPEVRSEPIRKVAGAERDAAPGGSRGTGAKAPPPRRRRPRGS